MTLGEYVRGLRRKIGWSLQTISDETGLSYHHLSRIENDSAVPGVNSITAIAESLRGDLKLMFELAGSVPQQVVSRMTAGDASTTMRRAAGQRRAAIESPRTNAVELARSMGVPASEVEEVASAVLRLLQFDKRRRSVVVQLVRTLAEGGRAKR
jgi:transcriptional regulator with XRE-family HTH domain